MPYAINYVILIAAADKQKSEKSDAQKFLSKRVDQDDVSRLLAI